MCRWQKAALLKCGKSIMAFTSTLRGRIRSAIASATIHLDCNGLARILTVAAFSALLSIPGPIQAQTAIVINQDLGGSVESRLRGIEQLRVAGTRIEIRGQCASACTMLLGLPNTCVARSSRLGFHGPQSQYYGIALPPEEFEYWSHIMASHYPEPPAPFPERRVKSKRSEVSGG